MKPKTDKQGWEEEFDNKVKEMPKKLIELVEWNKIKDFIRQLYQQTLAEGKRIGREESLERIRAELGLWRPWLYEKKVTKKDKREVDQLISQLLKKNKKGEK